jgi:hypothetical protein
MMADGRRSDHAWMLPTAVGAAAYADNSADLTNGESVARSEVAAGRDKDEARDTGFFLYDGGGFLSYMVEDSNVNTSWATRDGNRGGHSECGSGALNAIYC